MFGRYSKTITKTISKANIRRNTLLLIWDELFIFFSITVNRIQLPAEIRVFRFFGNVVFSGTSLSGSQSESCV